MSADSEITEKPKTLPLDDWHRGQGARMVPFAGYEMPIQYEDGIMAEHLWTRAEAGLFDVSHMGQLMFTGEGLDEALEALLPLDLSTLGVGRMRYTLILDDEGGILDDCIVTRAPQGIYIVVNGAVKHDDIAHFERHLPDGVSLNHMEDRALIALQGPKAAEALESVVAGADKLVFMQADSFLWGEHPLWISRAGYTGEDGFEISLPADIAADFVAALGEHPAVRPIGLGARDSLRLEAGLPLYGHDLDRTTTPVAADLRFAMNKRRREQGGFVGAEKALAEVEGGAPLKRVGLLVDGRQPVREGSAVLDDAGNEVGRVTSGGFSPSLERSIAMAYVPAAMAAEGTPIKLKQRKREFTGTVAAMPLVPHRYVRKGKS